MSNLTKYHRIYFFGTVVLTACLLSGCGFISSAVENVTTIVGLNETGTVIAKRAQIRSSYAVVAADLLEVKRGDKLQILEETDFEKVKWYRVRANDEDRNRRLDRSAKCHFGRESGKIEIARRRRQRFAAASDRTTSRRFESTAFARTK